MTFLGKQIHGAPGTVRAGSGASVDKKDDISPALTERDGLTENLYAPADSEFTGVGELNLNCSQTCHR